MPCPIFLSFLFLFIYSFISFIVYLFTGAEPFRSGYGHDWKSAGSSEDAIYMLSILFLAPMTGGKGSITEN